MITSGVPDYSEVFNFGWTGTYVIRVKLLLKGAAKPLNTSFTRHHVV